MSDNKKFEISSDDLRRNICTLIEQNISPDANEGTKNIICNLVSAAIARAKHETLSKFIDDALHAQKAVRHLH